MSRALTASIQVVCSSRIACSSGFIQTSLVRAGRDAWPCPARFELICRRTPARRPMMPRLLLLLLLFAASTLAAAADPAKLWRGTLAEDPPGFDPAGATNTSAA